MSPGVRKARSRCPAGLRLWGLWKRVWEGGNPVAVQDDATTDPVDSVGRSLSMARKEVPSPTPVLNEGQRGRLKATFLLLEKGMDEIEAVLDIRSSRGLFRHQVDDLSGETRETIRAAVRQVRTRLGELKREFCFPAELELKSRLIFGKTPILWEAALDATTKSLKQYGPVSAELPAALDPVLEEIGRLLIAIEKPVVPDRAAVAARLDRKNPDL